MVRVVPLFIHRLARREPIIIYGREKTLDFTYVDDCVDGIAHGIERLFEQRVVNETINLAYGEGNTLHSPGGADFHPVWRSNLR